MVFSANPQHRFYARAPAAVLGILACFTFIFSVGGQAQPAAAPPRLDIDGRRYPPEQQYPHRHALLRFAPDSPDDHKTVLNVENLALHDAVNQRALEIEVSSTEHRAAGDNAPATYSRVVLRNCEVFNLQRDDIAARQEHHIEAVRISGGGEQAPFDTEVVIEDLSVHDGNLPPLLVQEGNFSTITLRRLRFHNLPNPQVQIVLLSGAAKRIVVEDCPNVRILISGRPGSVGECVVKNSPGAEVVDGASASGKSGVAVVMEKADEARGQQQAKASLKAGVKGRQIRVVVENVPSDAAAVQIEAFDAQDYRVGTPVVLTEGPWEASFRAGRPGVYSVQCTVTRLGGDPDKPVLAKVEVGK